MGEQSASTIRQHIPSVAAWLALCNAVRIGERQQGGNALGRDRVVRRRLVRPLKRHVPLIGGPFDPSHTRPSDRAACEMITSVQYVDPQSHIGLPGDGRTAYRVAL